MFPSTYDTPYYFPPSYFPEHGADAAPGSGVYYAPSYFPAAYDAPTYFPGTVAESAGTPPTTPYASPLARLLCLVRDRRGAAAPAPDFLSALVAYLRSVTVLTNALGHDPWGNIKIYESEAPAFPNGVSPYPLLLITDYEEDTPGETLDDEKIPLNLSVVHTNLDLLRTLSRLVKNTVDSIADNPNSTRTGVLSFADGQESGVIRYPSRPYRVARMSGSNYIWREDIEYEFWVTPDQ